MVKTVGCSRAKREKGAVIFIIVFLYIHVIDFTLNAMSSSSAGEPSSPLELEHVVGWTGVYSSTLICHPIEDALYFATLGAAVVIGDVYDPHKQRFLRGHDAEVSALDVSATSRFAASGQRRSGNIATGDAAVIVWDTVRGSIVYTFFGLTEVVQHVSFSPDERFLAADAADNTIAIWDMTTGEQVREKEGGWETGGGCGTRGTSPDRPSRSVWCEAL